MDDFKLQISTSWDDGSPHDLKLFDMLQNYSIPAIFFIPARNHERDVMTPTQIRYIGKHAEIGSHTQNHATLTHLSRNEVQQEIAGGRLYLEDILAKPVEHFCFPRGKYNDSVLQIARNNVKTVRSTRIMAFNSTGFLRHTSFQVVYRNKFNLFREVVRFSPFFLKRKLLKLALGRYRLSEWVNIAIDNLIEHNKGTFHLHLWGHSWEIDRLGLWQELDDLFAVLKKYQVFFTKYGSL